MSLISKCALAFVALILPNTAPAEAKKLDLVPRMNFQPKSGLDESISTKETVVNIEGKQYKRIEMQNDVFYVRFDQGVEDPNQVLCAPNARKDTHPLGEGSVKISKRTRVFFEGLTMTCRDRGGRGKPAEHAVDLRPDATIGLGILHGKNKDDETKILYNPLTDGLGVQSSW